MEPASMLAGEEFSDHPRSVCPIVAGFLRNYNDGVHDEQRDDLYRFAAEAVGTRAGADVTAARARLCHEWITELRGELLHDTGPVLSARLRWWPVLTARPDDPPGSARPRGGCMTGRSKGAAAAAPPERERGRSRRTPAVSGLTQRPAARDSGVARSAMRSGRSA